LLWFLRLVALLLGGRFGVLLLRIAGLPQCFEQRQLLFGKLFAFAIALRIEQFAQQAPVLVLFRTLVPELLAQIDYDLAQHIGVFGQ
jgi:hypothetical protein